jgi:uncharacterized protein YxjI
VCIYLPLDFFCEDLVCICLLLDKYFDRLLQASHTTKSYLILTLILQKTSMSLPFNTCTPNHLQALLDKAHIVKAYNQKRLAFIHSRKAQQVVTHGHYIIQQKPCIPNATNNDDDSFTVLHNKSTKAVQDILSSWSYHGKPLIQETFIKSDIVNIQLDSFDNLVKLHDEYEVLLDNYEQVLADTPKSCSIVECALHNMQTLQVAIDEIHGVIFDLKDEVEMDEDVSAFMKLISEGMKKLESKYPGIVLELEGRKGQTESDVENDEETKKDNEEKVKMEEENDIDVVEFVDCKSLTKRECKNLSDTFYVKSSSFIMNDKLHIAGIDGKKVLKVLDLSSGTVVSSTSTYDHSSSIAFFSQHGVPMLAVGNSDLIRIDYLTNNSINNSTAFTFSTGDCNVSALISYRFFNHTYLLTKLDNGAIKIWNTNDFGLVATHHFQFYKDSVLHLFHHHDKSYLASQHYDKSIKIFCLTDPQAVAYLPGHIGKILSFIFISQDKRKMLASGDSDGQIMLWDMVTYTCIGSIKTGQRSVNVMEVIRCDGKICLVSGSRSDGRSMKIWSLGDIGIDATNNGRPSPKLMRTIDWDLYTSVQHIEAFMKDGKPCLAFLHNNKIEHWM